MTPCARSGLAMIALTSAMCGAVIVVTEPLLCRQKELARLYDLNYSRRTPCRP